MFLTFNRSSTIFVILGLFLTGDVPAQPQPDTVSHQLSVSYEVADGETMIQARGMAAVKLKAMAIDRSMSLVSGFSSIRNGQLNEEITSVYSGLVKLDSPVYSVRVDSGTQQVVLVLSATAIVDLDSVNKRVKTITENQDLKRRISLLLEDNRQLQVRLHDAGSQKSERDTYTRHKQYLANIETINNTVSASDALALLNETQFALDAAIRDIENFVIKPIEDTKVKTEIVSAARSQNNDGMVNLMVQVSWYNDAEQMVSTLRKYLKADLNNNQISAKRHENIPGKFNKSPSELSSSVFNYLATLKAYLELDVGSKTVIVPLLYMGYDTFFKSCKMNDYGLKKYVKDLDNGSVSKDQPFCLSASSSASKASLGLTSLSNPLVISIPESEFRGGVSLSSRIKVVYP